MSWHLYDELHREDLLRRTGYPPKRRLLYRKLGILLLILAAIMGTFVYSSRHRTVHRHVSVGIGGSMLRAPR